MRLRSPRQLALPPAECCSPNVGPAASTAFRPGVCDGVAGSYKTATRERSGRASLSSSRLLTLVSVIISENPVTLPPGRARLVHVARAERVRVAHEDYRNRGGRLLGRPRVDGTRRHDHIDLQPDEFLRKLAHPIRLSLGPPELDGEVAPLDIAQLAQLLAECLQGLRECRRILPQKADAIHLPRLLCATGDWPRDRNATDQAQ